MSHHYDCFKTYPVRFCGYGYGMAEALRGPVGHPVIYGLYSMTTAFIFGHTLYKPYLVSQRSNSAFKVGVSAVDTLVYESIVSGIIPAFAAQVVKRTVSTMLQTSKSGAARLWMPSIAALAVLPIVIPPCDKSVDIIMDHTLRKLYY